MNAARALGRWLWWALALGVILYAVLVAIGREFLPRLDQLQPRIDELLSARLGARVSVADLDGDWTGLAPRLRIGSAHFAPVQDDAPDFLVIEGFDAELRLLRSLLGRQPDWAELRVRRLSIRLTETAAGWRLHGTPGAGGGGAVQRLATILLAARRTRIGELELVLAFRSGEEARLGARDLLLENFGSFHRVGGRVAQAGQDIAALAAEWRAADPVQGWRDSEGRAYLRFSRLDLSGALGVLLRGLAPDWARRLAPVTAPIAAELWLDAAHGRADLRGRIAAPRLPLAGALAEAAVRDLHADLTGWIAPGRDWGLRVQDLDFTWRDRDIHPLTLGFRQPLGDTQAPRFSVAADHLDLATLHAMAAATGLLPAKVAEILAALNPTGGLINPLLEIDLGAADPVTRVQAELAAIAVDSWRHSPVVRGVSGSLVATPRGGTLRLDGQDRVQLGFPTAYDHLLQVGAVRGSVDFALDAEHRALDIYGSDIEVAAPEGAGRIATAFRLWQPLTPGGEGEMWLSAGIRDTNPGYARQFLPKVLDPQLQGWLAAALGEMSIPEGAFIWRGPFIKEAGPRRTIQVYVRVADADIRFDPQWPGLTGVAAQVAVDDVRVRGTASTATIAGVPVADIRFRTTASEVSGKPLLAVTAQAATQADRGLAVLAQSPLRERVAALRDWQAAGQAEVDLDLAIPLSKDHRGERYRVAARLADASLQHGASGLRFENIRGELKFAEHLGLQGDAIAFRLWGQPLTATVRSHASRGIEFTSAGQVEAQALPGWPEWLRHRVSGTAAYRASYRIPAGDEVPRLEITSDLVGVQSELPAPFAKPVAEPLPLALRFAFTSGATDVDGSLGALGTARARLTGGGLERIGIRLGGDAAALPAAPGLQLAGHLNALDLDQWRTLLPADGSPGRALAALDPRLDLRLDRLRAAGLQLDDLHLVARHGGDAWQLHADSPTLSGTLIWPLREGGRPALDLEHLVLPKPDLDAPGSRLATLDPRALPELDFATRGLRVGNNELGEIAFALRRLPAGIRAQDIRGEITGLRAGSGDSAPPSLAWELRGDSHRSRFSGIVLADDLAGVLRAWNLPGAIESDATLLVADLEWSGRPWEFRARNLRGDAGTRIRDGTFHRASGATSSALMKLIGLVNFDTWLRRLQFDFSDLFASGVAFDELKTTVRFDAGILEFVGPVKVELPSGRMRLEGSADLIAETIDAHLVATLPVGTNLPWIAALAGGLPAAAGVYLTSRIFDRQVDRLSSLGYRVTGPWGDPRIEVERVFSDKAKSGPKAPGSKESGAKESGAKESAPNPSPPAQSAPRARTPQ